METDPEINDVGYFLKNVGEVCPRFAKVVLSICVPFPSGPSRIKFC